MTALSALAYALTIVGTALIAVAAIGLIRLPDAYNRANAVAKAASLGMVCVLLGVLASRPGVTTAIILLLAMALQLFTAPIGGYAVGRCAYRSGAPLTPATHRDELGGRV